MNYINHQLVVRPDSGINGIAGMHEKKLGTRGTHPMLNDWLFMKQHGLDSDRDDIEIICEIARRLGCDWGSPTAEQVWDECRSLSPMHA